MASSVDGRMIALALGPLLMLGQPSTASAERDQSQAVDAVAAVHGEDELLVKLARAIGSQPEEAPDTAAGAVIAVAADAALAPADRAALLGEEAERLDAAGSAASAEALIARRHETYLAGGGVRDEVWAQLVEDHARWLLAHDRPGEAARLQKQAVEAFVATLGAEAPALAPHLTLLLDTLVASAADEAELRGPRRQLERIAAEREPAAPIVAMGPASGPSVGLGQQAIERVRVFYATNRIPAKPDVWLTSAWYGPLPGAMQFGVTDVRVPQRSRDAVERNALWGFEVAPARLKNTAIFRVTPIAEERFRALVHRDVEASRKEILVYVHGYNVDFGEAVRVTANLAIDLDVRGASIAYSWPSAGRTLRYWRDGAVIADPRNALPEHLAALLRHLSEDNPGARIFVIAHSMGSRVAVAGLARLSTQRPATRLANVVLASPDIDAGTYAAAAPAVARITERLTLYASRRDWALRVSSLVNNGPRAGFPGTLAASVAGDKIDTTLPASAAGISRSVLGHSDYMGDALTDIRALLWTGAPVARRCILRQNAAYFTFADAACTLSDYANASVAVRRLGRAAARNLFHLRAEAAASDEERREWQRVEALVQARF